MTSRLFFDTDCISSFLWVNKESIILKLYPGRIVLPQEVFRELSNPVIPHIKRKVSSLISNGDITTQKIYIDTDEFTLYYQMAIAPPKGEIIIGKGEAAAISLAKVYNGIVASNNLKDISRYVKKFNLNHVTTGDILVTALEKGFIDESLGNKIWKDMLAKKRRLPVALFSDYLKRESKQ